MQTTNSNITRLLNAKASQVFEILLDLSATVNSLSTLIYKDLEEQPDFFEAFEAERERGRRSFEAAARQPKPGIPEHLSQGIKDDSPANMMRCKPPVGRVGLLRLTDLLLDLCRAFRELATRTTPLNPDLLIRLSLIESTASQQAITFCAAAHAQESKKRPSASHPRRVSKGMRDFYMEKRQAFIEIFIDEFGDHPPDDLSLTEIIQTVEASWPWPDATPKNDRKHSFPNPDTIKTYLEERYPKK
jgi:hypothetical protein